MVLHYVVFQWLRSALAINLTLFQESSTNDLEIAIDSNGISVFYLYTTVSWWRYSSLKSLGTLNRFYVEAPVSHKKISHDTARSQREKFQFS